LPDETPDASAEPSPPGEADPVAATDAEPDPQPQSEPEPEPEPEPVPEPDPDPVHVELLDRIQAELGDAVVEHESIHGVLVVRVAPDVWARVATVAKTTLECDFLSFISGIDWMPAPREGGDEAGGDTSAPVQPSEMTFGAAGSAGRFQLVAIVESTQRRWTVVFKSDVDEADPVAASWASVYPGADWHERETWEMFGVRFDGHPHLRHLYLPAEFEGHPLRKDYPLLARVVKPWPGLVDVEGMPEDSASEVAGAPEPAAVTDGGGES
jgi:NADH-quinone oxidoreductase subunit C